MFRFSHVCHFKISVIKSTEESPYEKRDLKDPRATPLLPGVSGRDHNDRHLFFGPKLRQQIDGIDF